MRQLFVFLFRRAQISANSKDSSRAASTAQNPMSQTKVAAYPYKSFGQACLLFEEKFERQRKQALPLSKACGNPKGKARGRSRRSETPQAHSNKSSKTIKRKAKLTNQKRNAAKKVGARDVTSVTI